MEGTSLVEVYERVGQGKSVIWVCERAQKSKQINLWLNNVEKTLCFCDLKDTAFTAV